jgi:hypothetical protein
MNVVPSHSLSSLSLNVVLVALIECICDGLFFHARLGHELPNALLQVIYPVPHLIN